MNSSPTSPAKQIQSTTQNQSPAKPQSSTVSPSKPNPSNLSTNQQSIPIQEGKTTPTSATKNLPRSSLELNKTESFSQSPSKVSGFTATGNIDTPKKTDNSLKDPSAIISSGTKVDARGLDENQSPTKQTVPKKLNSSDSIANNISSPPKEVENKSLSFSPKTLESQNSNEFTLHTQVLSTLEETKETNDSSKKKVIKLIKASNEDSPEKSKSSAAETSVRQDNVSAIQSQTLQTESSSAQKNTISENVLAGPDSKVESNPSENLLDQTPVITTLSKSEKVETGSEVKLSPESTQFQEFQSPPKVKTSERTITTQQLSGSKQLVEAAGEVQESESSVPIPERSPSKILPTADLNLAETTQVDSPNKQLSSSPFKPIETSFKDSFIEGDSISALQKQSEYFSAPINQTSPEKRTDTSILFNPISNNESFQNLSLSTEFPLADITQSNYNSNQNYLQTPNPKGERVDNLNKSPTFAKEKDEIEEPLKVTPTKMETPIRDKYKFAARIKGKSESKSKKETNLTTAKALLTKQTSNSKGSTSTSSHRRNNSSLDFNSKALDPRLSIPNKQKLNAHETRKEKKSLSTTRGQNSKRRDSRPKTTSPNTSVVRSKVDISTASFAKLTQSFEQKSKDISLNLKNVSRTERDGSKEKEMTFRKRSTDKKLAKLTFSASKNTSAFETSNNGVNQQSVIKESPEESKVKPKIKKYNSVLKNNLVKSINDSILATEKVLNYTKNPVHKSPKKGEQDGEVKKKENDKSDLLIDVQHGFVLCDEIDMNMLKRIKKSLTLIEENMISYKTLSTIKILNRPHSSITISTLALICLLAGAFEEIPVSFGKEVEEFENSLWLKAKPYLQHTQGFLHMIIDLPKKIDKEFPDYENITIAKKYLDISNNLLAENPQVTGYIFVEEINKYIESVLDHICLVREEGPAVQKILEKIETPAGNQITMIPFFEVPQERKKNYYIFSDKKKSNNPSYYSTPEHYSIGSPQKFDKTIENKNSAVKLINPSNLIMYTEVSAHSIQKIPELDTETSKMGTSALMTKSFEKSDFSMNISYLKTVHDTSQLHSFDADQDPTISFVKKSDVILEGIETKKKKNSRRNSHLETIYNSLSQAAPLPFGCPEMPNLDSSNFDHIENIENPTQITLYAVSAFCSLFAGAVPEISRTLIQSKELPGKYKAIRELYLRTPKKLDLIIACFHEFVREGLIDLTNSKEAQRIVKLYENISRISPKKMENSSKDTTIINFVKSGIQSIQYIEIKDRQLSNNSQGSHKKENPTRSITPSQSKPEISLTSKNRVLVPSNSIPSTKIGKVFNNYITKVHYNNSSKKEHLGVVSKNFQKELEKKYGYVSQDEEDFNTYSSMKVSSIKKELQKENNKPKTIINDQQSARNKVYSGLNKGETKNLSILEKYGVLGQKLGEQRRNKGSSKKAAF